MNYYYLLDEESQKKMLPQLELLVTYPTVAQSMQQDKNLYHNYSLEEYLCLRNWLSNINSAQVAYQSIKSYHKDSSLSPAAVRKFLDECMTIPYFREALVEVYGTSRMQLAPYAVFAIEQGLGVKKDNLNSYNRVTPSLEDPLETAENMVIGDLVHHYYKKDEILDIDRKEFISELVRCQEVDKPLYDKMMQRHLQAIETQKGIVPDNVLLVDVIYPHLTNISREDVEKQKGTKAPLEKHL